MKKLAKSTSSPRSSRSRRGARAPKSVAWSVRYIAEKPNRRIRSFGCSSCDGCG
jgi:hypothetical protein